ncbi:MAG: DinB family protein [Chlorobi bacterium]|nr:DinB family protein [Chlorobiota bacterium]MCI0715481.1 DinB family protein [Chlorobiota bacterium]
MVKRIRWTERKFEFNLPPGVFPNLLVRLLGTAPRIEDLTKWLSNEELSFKSNGKWSIKEHIGHLIDLEELHEKRLAEILQGKGTLTAADMTNRKTNDANHNLKSIAELLSEFRRVREDFVNRLEALDEGTILKSGIHPRLNQPMRIIDIAYFTSEHDDHHLTIIKEIINIQTQ